MILTLANGTKFDTNTKNPVLPTKTKSKLNGVVLYNGNSMINNAPIVVIATFNSNNEKTGDMIQTWILDDTLNPLEASKEKKDRSVCGMCPHRRSLGGACYVSLHQAPLQVYKAYKAGKYETFQNEKHSHLFLNRSIRLGAYGDPAAVPFEVWENVLQFTKNHTGYTHQASMKNFDKRIAEICMISCDTEKQALKYQKLGFKTFRVKTENMQQLSNEIECLSDSHNISCLECGLCNGQQINIVINVHGALTKRFKNKFEVIKTVNL